MNELISLRNKIDGIDDSILELLKQRMDIVDLVGQLKRQNNAVIYHPDREKEIIDRVIEQMSDWSASAISEYSHKDMPWLASKDGDIINYELAFYREPPFSVRNYEEDDAL